MKNKSHGTHFTLMLIYTTINYSGKERERESEQKMENMFYSRRELRVRQEREARDVSAAPRRPNLRIILALTYFSFIVRNER